MGFVFNTKTKEILRETVMKRFAGVWEEHFTKLLDFKKKNGHCAVPRRYKADPQLASWVMRQVSLVFLCQLYSGFFRHRN